MTQPRTRKWTPGDELAMPEEQGAPAMDPATSKALASLQSFVQPPPVLNKTLTGYAHPAESHHATAAWSPSVPKQPPPLPPYRRTKSRVQTAAAAAPVAEPVAGLPPAAPSVVASEPPPPAVVSVAPRAQQMRDWKALSGWITAAVMFVFGIAFYSLAYRPLWSDFSSLEHAAATQLKQRDAELATLRAELAGSHSREPRTAAAAAAPVQVAPVEIAAQPRRGRAKSEPTEVPVEPKHAATQAKASAAEPKPAAGEPTPTEAHDAHESSDAKAKGKVNLAAAAAATAALEAQVYGSNPKSESAASPPTGSEAKAPAKASAPRPSPAPEGQEGLSQSAEATANAADPKAAPPSAADKNDSLADIERGPSDDPLEGL